MSGKVSGIGWGLTPLLQADAAPLMFVIYCYRSRCKQATGKFITVENPLINDIKSLCFFAFQNEKIPVF
jgi:hypothetical protein